MVITSELLSLQYGLSFEDLYNRDGLVRLDQIFVDSLKTGNIDLFNRLMAARAGATLAPKEASELIIALAPAVDEFIGELFGITTELRDFQDKTAALAPKYIVKRKFVHKKALTGMTEEKASAIEGEALASDLEALFGEPVSDDSFAANVHSWMGDEKQHAASIQKAAQYAAWATLAPAGRQKHRGTTSVPGAAGRSTIITWFPWRPWWRTASRKCCSGRSTGGIAKHST